MVRSVPRSSEQPALESDVNASGVNPPRPTRAEDFARGFAEHVPGTQKPSPNSPTTRGPITPAELFFGDQRKGFDFGQLTPVDVGNVPNKDDARLVSRQPQIDTSPSVGATVYKESEAIRPWGPPDGWSRDK